MKNKIITRLLALIVTVSLLYILLSEVQIEEIVSTLLSLDPFFLILGFVAYATTYLLRALRFSILLHDELRISDLFSVVCAHNMANNILPARTGELSYVYLLNKICKKSIGDGFSTLVVARVFDFVFITLFFVVSALVTSDLPEGSERVIQMAVLFLSVILFLLSTLLFFPRRFINFIEYIAGVLGAKESDLLRSFLSKVEEVLESFGKIRSIGRAGFSKVFLVTFFIWLVLYIMIFILARGMGIDLEFISMMLASSFSVFTNVLPIQGVGGFGTVEGGWTIGFVALGLDLETAISTGFTYHIVVLIYVFILGLLGLLGMRERRN
jgi:hypothetical protein